MTEYTERATGAPAAQNDVQGHFFHFLVPAAVIITGAVLITRELTKGPEPLSPPIFGPGPTGAPETINTGGGPIPIG